jgi:hypothetical protein
MAITKRTRFEVLRRDNHTCRYCGAAAPDAKLTVDHVTPVALGGTDDPSNLVAACRDCNYGKSSTTPDAALVEDVKAIDLQWADAIKRAAVIMRAEHKEELERSQWFLEEWKHWDDDLTYLPDGWRKSVDCWLDAGLSQEALADALDIALGVRTVTHRGVFAYMGGIARKRVEKLHETARALLDEEVAADGA